MNCVFKLLPGLLFLFACAVQAQQPITLTAVTPKILGVSNYNDGVTLTAQATGPGSFSFNITSYDGTHGSGTVRITPPATLTAVDNGSYLYYPGFAQFSGQGTWSTDDPFISVFWSSDTSTDQCDSNPLMNGSFSCKIGSLFVENVGGQRYAYFDGYIYYRDTSVDFGYEINVRMYYQIPSTTQSVIEAVQVTQSLATDTPSYAPTPLIAGKTTTIRLYPIQSGAAGQVGGQIKVISDHLLGTLQAHYNVLPQSSVNRDSHQFSFDFEIPAAWTTKGDLTIGGQFLDIGSGVPPSPDPITLHFQNQAKPFSVRYMEWCAPISNPPPGTASATPVCTSKVPGKAEDMADAIWYARATYPTADDGIVYRPWVANTPTWTGDMRSLDGTKAFINYLRRWYIVMKASGFQDDQLIAWFPYDPTWAAGGEADAMSYNLYPSTTPLSAVGHVAWVSDQGIFHNPLWAGAEESLAHEIGHNLGLRHPATADWGGAGMDSTHCFPYASSHIQNPGYYSVQENAMHIPTTAWDFMSYHSNQQTWVTPYTYDILVRGGLQPQGNSINRNWDPVQKKCVAPAAPTTPHAIPEGASPQPTEQLPRPEAAVTSNDSIMISGTIAKNGSVTMVPSYRVPSGIVTDQSDATGLYCINFQNGATTLSSFCFNASFDDPEGGDNSLTTDSFSFVIPFPTQTSSITLTKQSIQLASIAVSKNAPVVSFTSPKNGDTWNGGSQTISWTASDADGDPLMFTVLYSSDGGNSYLPMALDLTNTQYPIDPSTIMGGSVYFRVLASDGINTTTATVGPITVNQTPKLTAAAASFAIGNATTSTGAKGIVTLVSNGSGPVTITSASIDNSSFAIAGPPMPLIIPAGHRASLSVTFLAPQSAQGVQTGTITVASNDPLSPLKIPITGNTFANAVPNAVIGPKSLTFAAAPGQTQNLTIGVANTGSANLTVNSVSISNASFALIGVQTPLTVAPNTSQLLTVRFTAPGSGVASGTATIATNDPTTSAAAVTLTGDTLPGPLLSIVKTHSGVFRPSQQGATFTITVSNTGSAASSGTVTVTDTVPSGMTFVSMAGAGWTCIINSCTRSDALSPGSTYPNITATVNIAANAPLQLTNSVSVSGGGAATANAIDPTTITQALGFFTLTPCRLADTRSGQGKSGSFGPPSLNAYAGRDFPVLSSTCAVPNTALVYSTNLTVVPPGTLDFLSAWPAGQPYPNVSTLNSPDGSVLANAAILPAGNNGAVTVVTGKPTDLIMDVNGYFALPNGQDLMFYPVTPCRIADTRSGQGKSGAFGPPNLAAYAGRDFPIPASTCGIPITAKAYSLNVTAVPRGHLDFLSTWPTGQAYPGVSTLNSPDGSVIANAAIVPAGTNGAITVAAGNPADVIIDINGYFAPPSANALHFYPMSPCRIVDTRNGQGKTGALGPPALAASSGRDFPLQSSSCNIPAAAQAYSLNLTAIPAGHLDFLSTWPTGQAYPGVSTLNSPKGTVIANAAIVPAGTGGSITVVAGNPTDLIIDINGYFAP